MALSNDFVYSKNGSARHMPSSDERSDRSGPKLESEHRTAGVGSHMTGEGAPYRTGGWEMGRW